MMYLFVFMSMHAAGIEGYEYVWLPPYNYTQYIEIIDNGTRLKLSGGDFSHTYTIKNCGTERYHCFISAEARFSVSFPKFPGYLKKGMSWVLEKKKFVLTDIIQKNGNKMKYIVSVFDRGVPYSSFVVSSNYELILYQVTLEITIDCRHRFREFLEQSTEDLNFICKNNIVYKRYLKDVYVPTAAAWPLK